MKALKKIYHFILAFLGNIIYFFPSRKIFVLGVTGTKGKSTVLELINAILEKAGYKTVLISSVRIKIDNQSQINFGNSMPGRLLLKKLLRQAVKAKCQYALVEVTSEGVVQYRHLFIDWDAGFFINLKPEHIEAHGSFEKYREAKLSFFKYLCRSSKPKLFFFINKEDENASFFEKVAQSSLKGEIFLFSGFEFQKSEIYQNLQNPWLKTEFNLENTAAAVSFAQSQKIDQKIILEALNSFPGVPGRFEFIQKEPFAVMIDYAHTPDSLEKVYRELYRLGYLNLICVFGSAGGGRDKWKRPVMGNVAQRYCQEIILTNEDPYDDDPEEILKDIEKGIKTTQIETRVWKILDRKEAIKKALILAYKNKATVVITGKGSEPFIHLAKGEKIKWNEKEVVEECLKELKSKNYEI